MKGSPFRARIARDGSLRVYAKDGERNSVEAEAKEWFFGREGIKNLDKLRPDGYRDGVWYEVKVGSTIMMGRDWWRGSRYFPDIYFPAYYGDIDRQIDSYVSYGYCPLVVIVFDYADRRTVLRRVELCGG
ncbi:MAG: hypothetical protein RAK18_05905 [Conexivisphaerales archaeon]|nr:hypothetical protein [Conexivisphaerales archaeon]